MASIPLGRSSSRATEPNPPQDHIPLIDLLLVSYHPSAEPSLVADAASVKPNDASISHSSLKTWLSCHEMWITSTVGWCGLGIFKGFRRGHPLPSRPRSWRRT